MMDFVSNKSFYLVSRCFCINFSRVLKQVKESLDKDHIDSLQFTKNQLKEYFNYDSFDEQTTICDLFLKDLKENMNGSEKQIEEIEVFLKGRFFDYVSQMYAIGDLRDISVHILVKWVEMFYNDKAVSFGKKTVKHCINTLIDTLDKTFVALLDYEAFNEAEIKDGEMIHYVNYSLKENHIGFFYKAPLTYDDKQEKPYRFVLSRSYFDPSIVEEDFDSIFDDEIDRHFDQQDISFYRKLKFN